MFQPKANGSISFRQQSLKMNDENLGRNNYMANMNKSLIINADEIQREFGKDITNLTISNQENINPNLRKSLEVGSKENKLVTVIKYFLINL
jgi:hypothetical protein